MTTPGGPVRKPFVKICGITTPGDAVMAVESGAAAVGLVFWPGSPRAISRVEAMAVARAVGGRAALVGVFVNADPGEIRDLVETVPLDAVQLHGDEAPGIVDELRGVAVIKALAGGAIEAAGQWPSAVLALIDADDPVRRGGTGQRASWETARALAATRPVVLAGGLDASNLAAAVTEVGPLGVDVSSGVEEAPGRKSRAQLAALFDTWRALPGVTSAWPFTERSAARTMTSPLPPASSPVMREPVVPSPAFGRRDPDARGYFGPYGGRFVPETLVAPVAALEAAYFEARCDAAFVEELRRALRDFVGRPTPLYEARRLGAELGLRVLLKREDLAHTGAHKINNALGQALLARRMGKSRIVAETGAGQHGVATATVCAWLGLECVVYMGVDDMARQALNVVRMRLLGADVRGVDAGSRTLKDAINEAMRDWVARVTDTHYLLGSVLGPHPYPLMVREFQSVVGEEARAQCLAETGSLPAAVVASVGGGSNAMGLFDAFVADPAVRLVGVEAGGERIEPGRHAARFAGGQVGVLHGTRTLLLQDMDGNVLATHSVSAGLDYPAVGPEHAWLAEQGRAEYVFATDTEALEAFRTLGRLEGLLPALESAHAVAALRRLADTLPPHATVVVSLSGRGDKDVTSVQQVLDASGIARADEGAGHVADQ